MVAAMAAMAGASALGSLIGGSQAKKQMKASMAQQAEFTNRALAELEKVGIPSIEAQKIALETPELVFQYVPQLEQEFPEIKSQFDQIAVDPRLAEAQQSALLGMQERSEMGLTPEDMAQIDELRRGVGQEEASRQATILQDMERRGLGGSGQELAMKLASSQNAAQRQSEESDRLAAMQFQAKQAALQNVGSMSGQMRGQEFGEQAQQASAADILKQFSAQQQQGVQQRNVGSQNVAAQQKAQMEQQIENQRAAARQQEEIRNKGLVGDQFQKEMQKAGAASSALTGAAQQAQAGGAAQAQNTLGMWQGLGQAGMGAASLMKK